MDKENCLKVVEYINRTGRCPAIEKDFDDPDLVPFEAEYRFSFGHNLYDVYITGFDNRCFVLTSKRASQAKTWTKVEHDLMGLTRKPHALYLVGTEEKFEEYYKRKIRTFVESNPGIMTYIRLAKWDEFFEEDEDGKD